MLRPLQYFSLLSKTSEAMMSSLGREKQGGKCQCALSALGVQQQRGNGAAVLGVELPLLCGTAAPSIGMAGGGGNGLGFEMHLFFHLIESSHFYSIIHSVINPRSHYIHSLV
jgi:hypothetical protein